MAKLSRIASFLGFEIHSLRGGRGGKGRARSQRPCTTQSCYAHLVSMPTVTRGRNTLRMRIGSDPACAGCGSLGQVGTNSHMHKPGLQELSLSLAELNPGQAAPLDDAFPCLPLWDAATGHRSLKGVGPNPLRLVTQSPRATTLSAGLLIKA